MTQIIRTIVAIMVMAFTFVANADAQRMNFSSKKVVMNVVDTVAKAVAPVQEQPVAIENNTVSNPVANVTSEPQRQSVSDNSVEDQNFAFVVNNKTYNHDVIAVDEFETVEETTTEKNVTPKKVMLKVARNGGTYVGIHAGADMYNQEFTPIAGVEMGHRSINWWIEGAASAGVNTFNSRSEKAGDKYLTIDFKASVMHRLFDLPTKKLHQTQVFGGLTMGYRLRQDYNAWKLNYDQQIDENTVDHVTHESFYKVKGSTMTFGGVVRINFHHFMKRQDTYIEARAYVGHEYYLNTSEPRFGAQVTLGHTFSFGKTSVNQKAAKKVFGSVENMNREINAMRAARR